mgnify:FL=1
MVRIKISIGIIAAIIILGVAGIFVLDHKTDRVIDMLEKTKKYSDAGDTQMAIEAVGKLEQEWERYHTFASIFVRNDKITSVQTSMSRLRPLIEKDNDELNAEYENVKSGLEWIIESEIPKFSNIM